MTWSEQRASDEKMFKEYDEWRNAPKVYQPFRLTYLAYAKSVWELGLYKKVPPLLKNVEPVPFNNKIFNYMFGCENFVCRKGAIDHLPDSCKSLVIPGPLNLRGV